MILGSGMLQIHCQDRQKKIELKSAIHTRTTKERKKIQNIILSSEWKVNLSYSKTVCRQIYLRNFYFPRGKKKAQTFRQVDSRWSFIIIALIIVATSSRIRLLISTERKERERESEIQVCSRKRSVCDHIHDVNERLLSLNESLRG